MRRFGFWVLCLLLAACDAGQTNVKQPEPDSGWQDKTTVTSHGYMVSAARPEAVQAAVEMLDRGGSAMDAVIAAQMALNVAEPQSSGLGGGGFLLYYSAANKKLYAYDGRETAPQSLKADAFLDPQGKPLPLLDAISGGASTGVPGILRMLALAYKANGKLPWSQLFEPAETLAEHGVEVSPRLERTIASVKHLYGKPDFDKQFRQDDGMPLTAGALQRNLPLARTFRLIAAQGEDAFYRGAIAPQIMDALPAGTMSAQDLSDYKAVQRAPLCIPYRIYNVCSFGPPAGGIAVLETLGLLARFDLPSMPYQSADATHLMLEAEKLAFADRNAYVADPAYVAVPLELLSDPYLDERARAIDPRHAMDKAQPGRLKGRVAQRAGETQEQPSTTHISIVDAQGNAAALTSSIEQAFGSGRIAAGFLLNNQMTDFSFMPEGVNAIAPGKRPRSAMSPTMVFDRKGKLIFVVGSPGGARIIPYVVQTLLAVLDWHQPLQQALDEPHVLSLNGASEIEQGRGMEALGKALQQRGHQILFQPLNSGLHAVMVENGLLTGAADPRRDGIAMGK